MKILRIEHDTIHVGPANLQDTMFRLCLNNDPRIDSKTRFGEEGLTALSIARAFVAGCEDEGPSLWDGHFTEWWLKSRTNPEKNAKKSYRDYRFGVEAKAFDRLLKILKTHQPYRLENFERMSYQRNIMPKGDFSPFCDMGIIDEAVHTQYNIHSYSKYGKSDLMSMGSDLWTCVFRTPVAGGRLVIAEYEVEGDIHKGSGKQIAFHNDSVLSRKVIWSDDQDSFINLVDFSRELSSHYIRDEEDLALEELLLKA